MRKTNFLTLAVILLFLLNAVTLFFTFRWHTGEAEGPRDNGQGPAAYIIQTLKLDAQQQEAFAALRKEHQQAIRTLRQEDRRLHDTYFSLLKTDHPDPVQVDSVAQLIGGMEQSLSKTTFAHFEKLRALCNADQKKLFDATIDDIAHRMAPHPPGGRPPQQPDGPLQDGPPR